MNNDIDMNERRLTLLMSNLLITKMIFAFPRFLFKACGNAAWIQAIYMTLIAYLILIISMKLYRFTGKKSIIQLAEEMGGLPLKIFVSLIVTLILASNVGIEMRTFAESVKIILLPKTKMEIIMVLFAVTVMIGSLCGFGSLVTVNALFFPICLFFLAVMFVSLVPSYNLNNIFPILGTGASNIFIKGLKNMSSFSDIIALNLLLPRCRDIEMVKKSGRKAVLTAGTILTLICLCYGLTYPYPYSSEFLFVTYQMSRMVRAGEYFQRFEALFEFVWSVIQLMYTSVYVCLLTTLFADTFKLKHSRRLIPCIVILTAVLSFEPMSVVDLLDLIYVIKEKISPLAYLLPIAIPLFYMIFRRKKYEK